MDREMELINTLSKDPLLQVIVRENKQKIKVKANDTLGSYERMKTVLSLLYEIGMTQMHLQFNPGFWSGLFIQTSDKGRSQIRNIISRDVLDDFPECNCKLCGYGWKSRKNTSLPANCPKCGKKAWWLG